MRYGHQLLCVLVLVVWINSAQARDDKAMYSIAAALNSELGKQSFQDDVQFHFGTGNHPPVEKKMGTYTSNKKSNGVGKADITTCERSFISALISFRDRATSEGGNAVVNITSYYKKNHISSATDFECGSGAIMSGVTLRGDVVKTR
jgi:hypothetical protein